MESGQSFPDFVMSCARAFGACVTMRDDAPDAPIPEKFEPDNFYVLREKSDRADLRKLEGMTKAERLAYGRRERTRQIKQRAEWLRRDVIQNQRLSKMEEQVNRWMPPTAEHVGVKTFMLEQLRISKHGLSYSKGDLAEVKAKKPLQFWFDALADAKRRVENCVEEQAKENERAKKRTEWVQKLRTSIAA